MFEPQEIPEKVESSLTPQEILKDIAHHAIEFTRVSQEIAKSVAKEEGIDPIELEIQTHALKDHHMWMIVLAALLMPEKSENSPEE